MLDVDYNNTSTSVLHHTLSFPSSSCSVSTTLHFPSHILLSSPPTWLISISSLHNCFSPLTLPTTLNPFFFSFFLFHGRISTALFNIHISIFIIPLRSTLTSKKKLPFSLARWIIIPSSVRPCQSINLTCHLLSFLSGSVKGWLPLLSLYLSLSLCVQIPRLSPPDWIIQFRCHLFHSWQRGLLCTLLCINCGSNRPTARTHPPIRLLISLSRNATPFRFHIHFLSPFFFSKLAAYTCEEGFSGAVVSGDDSLFHTWKSICRDERFSERCRWDSLY